MATKHEYENEVAAPQNKGVPVKYKTQQYAKKTNDSRFNQLAALAGITSDVLSYMRPQQDPNEFHTEAHKRAITQSNTALSAGRGNANRMFGAASNLANTVGNKATQALLAQSANAGYEGGNAAAAVGSIGKDRALSEATLNTTGMAAQMSNQVEQAGVDNQLKLSQDTQLMDPGARTDESVLAGISAIPSEMVNAKRQDVESQMLNRYDRYGRADGLIPTEEEKRLQAEASKAVPLQEGQIPAQSAQGDGTLPEISSLNLLGKNPLDSIMGRQSQPTQQPLGPLGGGTPAQMPQQQTPFASSGLLGKDPLKKLMKPKTNFTQWGR